jgi:hypothetical protein
MLFEFKKVLSGVVLGLCFILTACEHQHENQEIAKRIIGGLEMVNLS